MAARLCRKVLRERSVMRGSDLLAGGTPLATAAQTWIEEQHEVAGTVLRLVKGGSGPPLLVLHDEMGNPGWLDAYEALAAEHTLYVPSHPGFDGSPRLAWIATVRDLACWYVRALEELGLGRVPLLGCSFGGWLAAEIAAICPHLVSRLVLVSPPGLRPPQGEIFDMFLVTTEDYLKRCFVDEAAYERVFGGDLPSEERHRREAAREQACLLTWRPYMYDPALLYLLPGIKAPTLLVWGKDDAVVPPSAGELYRDAIPQARLELLDGCGHFPYLEQPDAFVRLARTFLPAQPPKQLP
jgi:pimeloyl-ACP methyl ester carboxylesterase